MQRKFISLMLVGIIIFGGTPFVKQVFIDSQIHRAEYILKEYGYSKEGLMRASRVWFLEWALTSKFIQNLRDKEGTHWEKSLYQTLFDRSIIGALEGKLDASLLQARSSDATTQAARGENAKVELHSALYDSTILPHEGIIKTTVTYELQNTDRTDEQEVVYMIELPRADAAMVDLRLGLNLEMEGILAPRGAASAVYRDAIRARRDPALLEQV